MNTIPQLKSRVTDEINDEIISNPEVTYSDDLFWQWVDQQCVQINQQINQQNNQRA
jgi:hypothetical protein